MYKWLNNINTRHHSRDHSIFIRTFSTLHKVNTIESRIRKRDKFFTRRTNTPLYFIIIINHSLFRSIKNEFSCFSETQTYRNLKISIYRLLNSSRWTQNTIERKEGTPSPKRGERTGAKYFHFHPQREISTAHNRLPHRHPLTPIRGNGTVRPRQNGGVGRKFIRIPANPWDIAAKESRIPSIRASNRPRFPPLLHSSFSRLDVGRRWNRKSPGIRGSHIAGKPTDWEPCLSLMPARVTGQTNL